MDKTTFPFSFLGLFSCASNILSANCSAENSDLTDFQDNCWYLDEIRMGTTIIAINRENKPYSIYTIMFNTERFAGVGTPNHFFGLYSTNKDHSISFKKICSTRMVPIFEIHEIKEHEYFKYIERATQWKIREGKLELYSSKENGGKVILVFSNDRE